MSLVERVPGDKDKLIGQAVGWFLKKQDPDQIEFVKRANGYQIKVYCGEDEVDEAREFWEENIDPQLGGNG